jgi:hypothetical protein
MASKVLQTPVILEIEGGKIRIAHPNIAGNLSTEINENFISTATTLTVSDNSEFADNDFILLGAVGDNKSEEIDINGTPTLGTVLTVTNTTAFDHSISTPVTKIYERGIKIYGAATDGGSLTLIESVDALTTPLADAVMIQWGKEYTEFNLDSGDTSYAFYVVKFTDGTTDSSASIYVPASGHPSNSVARIVKTALGKTRSKIDDNLITYDFLVEALNDWQDEVANYSDKNEIPKDWAFEIFHDKTSLSASENVNSYALSGLSETLKYSNTKDAILNVHFGKKILDFIDYDQFDEGFEDTVNTTLASGASIGATSVILTDSAEFGTSGSISIGALSITYTANDKTTNTLSGIPASGAGSITSAVNSGDQVWQGVSPSLPRRYTIFNGNILLDKPVKTDYVSYKIKIKGLKQLSRLVSMASKTDITFTYVGAIYLAHRIEERKGNLQDSELLKATFDRKMAMEASKQPELTKDMMTYYNFDNNHQVSYGDVRFS